MTAPKKTSGFTLIELMVTLALFAVLLSFAIPLFSGTRESVAQENGMQELLLLCTLARERAVMEARPYGVQLDLTQRTYWLVRREGSAFEEQWERIPEKWGQTRALPENMDFHSETPLAVFYPDGSAQAWNLEARTNKGKLMTLAIDPALGRGSVTEDAS